MKLPHIYFLIFTNYCLLFSQIDSTKYQWPTPGFNSSRGLNGTFGEFRNTGSSDHFHNAVDIGEPNDNPVYPSLSGIVHSYSNNGYDSYINIRSTINGMKKHITYYHVVPSPNLYVNMNVVKGSTIIGNIYNGAAHVHLIEYQLMDINSSSYGTAINPVRPDGGLTPYFDSQSPVINISSIKFFKDNSSVELSNNFLTGKVDIRIEVKERNGVSSSQINNGTYILGYRILSDDLSQVIYEPEFQGMKYKFYFLPSNGYVHNVFAKGVATLSNPVYWLTNGLGEENINQTLSVPNNYLDTDLLEAGDYKLEIFSEDTRGNKTSKLYPMTIAKLPPELLFIEQTQDSMIFKWSNYNTHNLIGYRIYYSELSNNNWELAADEVIINSIDTELRLKDTNQFKVPTSEKKLKYFLVAVDSLGNESDTSDIYTAYHANGIKKILIVDGFDRFGGNGSWNKPNHSFNIIYTSDLIAIDSTISISSAANELIQNDGIDLKNYDLVIWFLGDESKEDNTLTNNEQYNLAMYLESGGNLFITGEDIGLDLDTEHSFSEFSDTLFYHQYLKSKFIHDGIEILYEVNGADGTIFENMNVQFGQTYVVDAPDDIEPINGAIPVFNYTYTRDNTFRKGGIAFNGFFGTNDNSASLVYLAFPYETIGDIQVRRNLMNKILSYSDFNIVDIENGFAKLKVPNTFKLGQNYPNPFNPTTTIRFDIPALTGVGHKSKQKVILKVFNILGKEIVTLVNENKNPGSYSVLFNGNNLSSGVYYYQLITESFVKTKKMILIK